MSVEYAPLGSTMIAEIRAYLATFPPPWSDRICGYAADEFRVPRKFVKQIRDDGDEAIRLAGHAGAQRATAQGRGNQGEFTRLGPKMVQAILREISARDEVQPNRGTPQIVADQFKVPLRLVLQILAHRSEAVRMTRIGADHRRHQLPEEPPPGRPLLPITRQQEHEIVERWIHGDDAIDIAETMGLALDVVVACLGDAGYSVALEEVES